MQEFRSVLLHCGLIDLGFLGNQFTWNNGREGDEYVQQSWIGLMQHQNGEKFSLKYNYIIL